MDNTLITIGIAVTIVVLLIIVGRRTSKIKDYSDKVEKDYENAHKALLTHRNYIILTVIFFLVLLETQNVAIYVESYMKVPNAFGSLLAFGIISIVATTIGAYLAKSLTEDNVLSSLDIMKIFFFFLISLSAEGIYLLYGYNVHIAYYEINIEQRLRDFKELQNPIYGYKGQELITKLRNIQHEVSKLTIAKWEGYWRMLTLVLQVFFNIILNYAATFGYANSLLDVEKTANENKDKNQDNLDLSKGGDKDFLTPLTAAPDPFRQD